VRFRYKSGYRKTDDSYRSDGFLTEPDTENIPMSTKTIYKEVESAIKQGDIKLKNESIPSRERYILDFLFYIRAPRGDSIR